MVTVQWFDYHDICELTHQRQMALNYARLARGKGLLSWQRDNLRKAAVAAAARAQEIQQHLDESRES